MKRIFKAPKHLSLLLITLILFACDKEFNSIDSDVIGEENINFNASTSVLNILAYNKKLDAVQINNLNSSLLGFYKDPIYGQTTASLIAQVTPETNEAPDFGTNAVLDSVILNIPYFSRATGELNGEIPIYTLSDLYGETGAPIKLTIYRNNFFLRDFNPNSTTNSRQNYFSNASNVDKSNNYARTENSIINFDDNKGEIIYESSPEGFTPEADAVILVTGSGDSEMKTPDVPALRINLADDADKKAYWSSLILEKQGDLVLSNINNFQNYFRGLYFKAEPIENKGQMVLLNTLSTNSKITIHYTKDSNVAGERIPDTYVLNLNGNRVNPYINTFNTPLVDGDNINGDAKLYLKGAEGSMAIVDLFEGLVECEDENGNITTETALDCFKKTYRQLNEDNYILKRGEEVSEDGNYIVRNGEFILKRLINKAQLVIYEDESIANSNEDHEFDRIYAYDIDNNLPTIDYSFDTTESTTNPEVSRFISLGRRTSDDSGFKYKIMLTEHLNRILVNDSTNTKLGLVLSNNVNIISNSEILENTDPITAIPTASILKPRGTVLYGSNTSENNSNKKMRLEIFLTEQKNKNL